MTFITWEQMTTEDKAQALHGLVEAIFQETEEAVDLTVAPEDLWEMAFQLKTAKDAYVNVLHGKCPTCDCESVG